MKTKVKRLSKRTLSVILAVLMLISCMVVNTIIVNANTVTNLNRVKFHADLTGYTGGGAAMSAWSNQPLTAADSNHYYGTFYTASGQSQKQFGWNVGGSNWGDSWCTMNGENFTATQTYEKTKDMTFNGSNDKVSTISAASGWVKLQIDWYGSYSNSSYVKFYQTAVTALSSSVSVGSSSLNAGATTTVTPSSSGGTGTPTNSVKVYQGSASGTDVTSSVLSGTTFTAPSVSSNTTYYIINTATDPTIKSYTKASAAKTITVAAAKEALPTPTISFTNSSITASSSGSATLTVTNHSTISGKDSGVSYELYKGGSKVTQSANTYTYSNGVFTIPARYSNAGSYTVKAIAANTTSYSDSATSSAASLTVTRTALSPSVTVEGNSSSATVTANPNSTVKFKVTNYSSLSGKATISLYKSSTKVADYSSDTINVAAQYSKTGTYSVKLSGADSEYYTTSNSGNLALTVNRTQLTAPTVTVSKTDIKKGDSINLTATDANSGKDTSQYNLYYYTNSLTVSDTYKLTSGTAKSLSPIADTTYKVVAYPVSGNNNEYYTQSSAASATQVKVYSPSYRIAGSESLIGSSSWSYSDGKAFTDYTSSGIFTFTTKSVSQGTYYFKLYDSNNKGYTYSSSSNTSITLGSNNKYTFAVQNDTYSFSVTGAGVFVIYYDTVNNKIWVTQNTWNVTTAAYTQDYNLATGSYKTATASTTGGTASPGSVNVEKGSATTLTATANSGYTFAGWYSSTAFTDGTKLSASASYSYTPSANIALYALFKQNEPAKVNISVANISHATITAKWNTQTKTNGQSLTSVPVGASVTVTVTPESDQYYVTSNTPTLSSGKFTVTASTTNITATIGENKKVTAKSNKSSRGTVSVSPQWAHSGQTVTVTVKEDAGKFKSVTATDSLTGTVLLNKTSSGATYSYNFTMGANAVNVNATFDAYSADSEYYYNGYDTSGNAKSGYHTKQMTEAMVNGQKFSYYEVTGRGSENDQLFTVSKGKPSSGTRYIYFTRPTDWGAGWSNSNNPHAYFLDASNNEKSGSWPGADSTSNYNNDYNQTVYKFAIPTGATNVIINDQGGSGKQTVNIDLTTTSGAYYLAGGGSGTQNDGYVVSEWDTGNSDQGWVDSGTEYFYSNTIYVDNFYTGGFYNHSVPNVNDFTKPKDGNGNTFSSCKDDYYIVVLYPNTTYTISYNGHDTTNTVGSEPMVLWMSELPIESDTIKIYAKDGSIRSETNGVTYANIADTQIVASSTSTTSIGTSASGNISGQTYETYKAEKGDTIYILTTIDNVAGKGADTTTNRNKYYVRGFCVNGEVYELLSWNSSGAYRLTYKIPEDYDGSKIEITPIYYLYDTTNNPIVTFRVNGFTDALKQVGSGKPGWGNTLYAYPFYGSMGTNNNAFGAYPGQPLVYYNGQYQIQIPEKSTAWDPYLSDSALSGTDSAKKTQIAGTYVSGITMSNGYYDSVHRSIMGYGDDSTSADHVQTYDYGDFYKIFNEKTPVDNIVYEFKYKTAKDNRGTLGSTTSYTASTLTSTYTNGFETLKNYHGRAVDLFGTPLSGDAADPTKTPPMYVISIAGPNGSSGVANIAGYYATEWAVFKTDATTVSTSNSYTRVSGGGKSSIPPEVLVLNDDDTTSFNTSTYPSAVSGVNITDWKTLYTNLEAYRGKPVLITYEKAKVQVGSNNYATSGGGGATRNDGRWLYSKTGESITSNIRIDVSTDNGETYTPNDDLATPVTGLSAYFTNAEADGETTYSTTIDPDKEFDFEAKTTNGEYKFVGWYFDDGVKITSDNAGSTERSGSYTLVARFMYVDSGQLILAHHVDKSDANYQGDGTTTMSVRVLNGSDEVIRTIDETSSDITLDDKIIASDKTDYKIYITLKTVPKVAGEDIFYRTTCTQANKFLNNTSYLATATPAEFYFTVGDLYSGTNQTVKSIIYNTKLSKTVYNYDFTFNYNGRLSDGQSYHKSGTLTAAQRETYVTGTGNEARVLSETFMNNIAPHESNFNQSYKWNITAADRTFTKTNSTTYTLTKTFNIQEKTVADEGETLRTTARTATFKLPYAYDTYGKATNTARMNKSSQADKVLNVSYGELIRDSAANNYSANDQARLQYYVTAPKILVDGGVDKTFQYWSIKKTGTDNEIARCYFESFNYVAYDNYTITPVFKADGDSSIVRNRTSASIDFLENSRNQWNDNGRGNYDTGNNTANNASDILFSDFALGFTLADGSSVADSSAEVGMVIQRIQKLQTKADGTPYTDVTDSVYDELQTVSADDLAQIRTFAGGGSAGSLSLVKDVVTKTNLDNKDMINYCHKFYNAIGDGDSKVNYSYKRYIYRAYAYIKVGNTVTLSDTPVYFTLWDEAAK